MARAGWLVLLGVAAALFAGSMPVHADKGVSVDLGKIEVSDRLSRGGSYNLPTMGVRNPGSEPANYVMTVSYLENQPERRPPESWFEFSPREFRLEPGETQPVAISLTIPTSARPAGYASVLAAQIVAEGEGAQVGAAAGAGLEFTVKPSNAFQAWRLKAETFMDDHAPWSYLLPVVVLLAGAAAFFSRRFSFRMERRT